MDHYDGVNIVARSPGHLRLEIPRLYRAQGVKEELESELSRHSGITSVSANPLTARVLIKFAPSMQVDALLGEFGISPGPAEQADQAPPASSPPQPAMYAPWHLRDADEALACLNSSRQFGLSQAEADRRLLQGLNTLPQPRPVSSLEILLNQFKSLPIMLLAASALVSSATGGTAEAAAIAAVLALNAGIGFVTERRAQSTIASLSELVDEVIEVLRNGAIRQIEASHVAPGDVLVLTPGSRLAADLRLLQTSGLLIDESTLTGESFPVAKDSARLDGAPPLADRRNMAYRGTSVAGGFGLGLAVGTGTHTEVGAIQALTTQTQRPKTPIQIQLDQLGNQLVKASSAMCLGVFVLGVLRGFDRLQMFKTAISLAIAAVPEGLPTVATTALARGLRRMREQQVLIRNLHAVETLGAIQTICLDKTGTLTMNRMRAVSVSSARHSLTADQAVRTGAAQDSELARLLQICVLCNESEPNGNHLASSPLPGSATELALLDLAAAGGVDTARLRERFPSISTELRAEGRNYMRTVHAMADSRRRLLAVKGSPDEVLAMCQSCLSGELAIALDDATRAEIDRQNQEMAEQQLRVLGFAYAELADPGTAVAQDQALTWVGLVGLADPLRPGVERVIERFHDAGIRTVMLTGDQAGTAYVIGKALHLNDGGEPHIVNSDELDELAPEQLRALAADAHIFSRVTPSHKLRIVQALQHGGHTIAMTGDGINDGPALRAADVGIAMGSGADVALSVADVALKHDQLETLLEAIRQGRTISTNIRKAVHFLLSSNLSEIVVVAGSVALGLGQPLTPMQLLWLNLLTDMLPAVAYAAEPADDDVMSLSPRDPHRSLVGAEDMWRYAREGGVIAAGALSAYLYGTLRHGRGQRAGTIAFDTLVLSQLLHALSCRSDRYRTWFNPGKPPNPQMALAIGASVALQGLVHFTPGLRRLLGIAPLDPLDILAILAGTGVPLIVNELYKAQLQSKTETRASAERSTSLSTSAPTSLSATLSAKVDASAAHS